MRTLTILTTLIALGSVAEAAGRVSNVVVYADRAQVTRVTPANCQKGVAEFSGLPSTLDTKTLRASAKGANVLGVTWKEEASGPRDKVKALLEQIKALDVKIVAQDTVVSATYSTDSRLQDFQRHMRRVWGVEARGRRAPVASWSSALDLMRKERLANHTRRREAQTQARKLRRERAELYRQMGQLNRQSRRTTTKATVMLRCQGGRPQVELSYVVPGATWRVTYQARADTQGRKLTLVAQAIVQQGTGEDWQNVRLAVSTANLRRQNTPPSVRRMYVTTYEPASKKKILQRRFERRRHLKAGAKTQSVAPGGARGKREPAAGKEPGLAMQLPAAGRVSVPSDGREILVTLASVTRRADFAYETVPKLFPFVYHRVELQNPFRFPMLPGPMALYRDRTFTGRMVSKLRAPNEPLKLSLGVDNQVQVHRWVKEEKRYEPGVLSSMQRLVHRYEIQVGNWTGRRRKVLILENVPVPQVKELEVKLGDKTTKPTRYDKKDGIISWELSLAPRGKKKIVLEYTVHVPKDYVVRGYVTAHK